MVRERVATTEDVPVLVRVINAAYLVEQFFIRGDRTSAEEVESLIRATDGDFLVLETPDGEIAGCVHAKIDKGRGYLGFLSVEPACQGQGLGRRLVTAVATYCESAGCEALDLDVFNLRPELPPFYASLGFDAQSEAPFEKQELLLQPAHLIRMTKPLRSLP
jgi:N-acetylglutamate synthase-like GNAT family acetyltransferase